MERLPSNSFLTEAQRDALDQALKRKSNTGKVKEQKHGNEGGGDEGGYKKGGHKTKGVMGDKKSKMGRSGGVKKGGAGGKYVWGKLEVQDGVEGAYDENDPLYDPDEDDGTVQAYKDDVMTILLEYLENGDLNELLQSVQELSLPQYDYYLVKRAITIAMDRKDREREMVSVMLFAINRQVVMPDQISKGFISLLEGLDDLLLDVPNAVDLLALFMARAVVDDVLPYHFVYRLVPVSGTHIEDVKQKCDTYLKGRHAEERLARCWGAGAGMNIDETKEKMKIALKEYLVASQDVEEVQRCLHELGVPFFHHEFVKQAVTMALEQQEHQKLVIQLLKQLSDMGVLSPQQLVQGYSRVSANMEDLALDIPNAPEQYAQFVEESKAIGLLGEEVEENVKLETAATSSTSLPEAAGVANHNHAHSVEAFKRAAINTVTEFFNSQDVSEVVQRLEELEEPGLHHIFVKQAIRLALDRKARERELVSELLSDLYPQVIPEDQMSMGFLRLLDSTDDLVLDIPDAVQLLAMFLCRAIVDEALTPAFLQTVLSSLEDNSLGVEVVECAGKLLTTRHAAERIQNCWKGGSLTVEEIKQQLKTLVQEYVLSCDVEEAVRCLREIDAPYYHHEAIKQALEALFDQPSRFDTMVKLFSHLSVSGEVNLTQMRKGFMRIQQQLDDMALDYPHAKEEFPKIKQLALDGQWFTEEE
eukprot:TRINITY_DN1825_c0_g1_i1.p1 TRINITY_DN1825_c0_g1~~TRINITY_DN1825_c0_g1_i1.p1  ORF type:complete len:701 (-),score=132.04 TRINITY_DN1825_c0_g1_i1:372-2474(-)